MVRRLLGLLLVAMAAGQLSDIGGFVDIVAGYQVGGAAVAAVIAAGLIGVELAGGIGLVGGRGSWRPAAATIAVVVAAAWTVLAAQAFARGLVVASCGCFGVHLGQPLRWWVLIEDAELLALALWVRHRTLGPRPGMTRDGARVLLG